MLLARLLILGSCLLFVFSLYTSAQNTDIKGFVHVTSEFKDNKTSFYLGEQDLFITSDLSDRISFLGETVFKYAPSSETQFNVSIERILVRYNFTGNHNFYIGKDHTPLLHWNDAYHHGRVFFPTIFRPALFADQLLPIHTRGVGVQGHSLTDMNIGYDLMIGNGIGSEAFRDNNKWKSVTATVYMKPQMDLKFGVCSYFDRLTPEDHTGHTHNHGQQLSEEGPHVDSFEVQQTAGSAYVSYFGSNVELLGELLYVNNKAIDEGPQTETIGYYGYAGYRINNKLIPYFRFDNINYEANDPYFVVDNKHIYNVGIRYEFNYLATFKMEYQHVVTASNGRENLGYAQIAIGF